jgi:hypothetical protein
MCPVFAMSFPSPIGETETTFTNWHAKGAEHGWPAKQQNLKGLAGTGKDRIVPQSGNVLRLGLR